MGKCSVCIKLQTEAEQKFKKAIEIDPFRVNSYISWVFKLSGIHKFEEAIKMYKKALAIEPNNLIVANFIKITEAMMWVERLTKKEY